MKTAYIILSLILSIAVLQSQTYEDGRAIFEKKDKKLNNIYHKLLLEKQSDPIFIKNLKASQRIWIQFRDAQFTLKYPNHASIGKRDPLPINQAIYLARLTEDRTKVLLEWLGTSTSGSMTDYTFDDNTYDENGSEPVKIYVSDLEIIQFGNVHGEIGIDKPYWTDELAICGKKYKKGIVMHPEDGGIIAYAEFQLPQKGGRLLGVAGWAEEAGVIHRGKMRFRILVDGEPLYGGELNGNECRSLNLNLGSGKILRLETDDGLDGNESDHMAFGDLRIIY